MEIRVRVHSTVKGYAGEVLVYEGPLDVSLTVEGGPTAQFAAFGPRYQLWCGRVLEEDSDTPHPTHLSCRYESIDS